MEPKSFDTASRSQTYLRGLGIFFFLEFKSESILKDQNLLGTLYAMKFNNTTKGSQKVVW